MEELRKQIDILDEQIVSLLKKRQELVKKIHELKKHNSLQAKDSLREQEIISRLKKLYDDELVEKVYQEIFEWSYS